MNEKHMGWPLTWGVRQDIHNLLTTFSQCDTIRFQTFAEVWRRLGFSLIYRDKNTLNELLEFSEEILQIAKSYLLPTHDFIFRVGAIYVLYSLYNKQPIIGGAKIRLKTTELADLKDVVNKCMEGKHYDVVYIHLKLLSVGAYWFVVTTRPCGLEGSFSKYAQQRPVSRKKSQSVPNKLISDDAFKAYNQLLDEYCNKKAELLGEKDLVLVTRDYTSLLASKSGGSVKCEEEGSDDEILDALETPKVSALWNADDFDAAALCSRRGPLTKKKQQHSPERRKAGKCPIVTEDNSGGAEAETSHLNMPEVEILDI